MKKSFCKGFMLVETLVVSVFIVGVLLFMYVQFQKIRLSYETSFKYNTVNSLYSANNIRKYIISNGLENLIAGLETNSFIDITNCPVFYLTDVNYCAQLFTSLNVYNAEGVGNINRVLFTKEDLIALRNTVDSTPLAFSEEMKIFIKGIKTDNENNNYRLVIQFNDDTYATLKTNK